MISSFTLFGPPHLIALALGFVVPVVLFFWTRRSPKRDRMVRIVLAAALFLGWLGWYWMLWARGWLAAGNILPLNLCDWAEAVLIVALLSLNQRAYELGYFWGLGATLQALITPDVTRGFPDIQFLLFMLDHAGLIVALLYLTLGTGLRPVPASLRRVILVTLFYALVAGAADYALGTNYGFLRGKGDHLSLLSWLAPWPWYIGELVLIGLLSALVCYAPFFISDRLRRPKISTS